MKFQYDVIDAVDFMKPSYAEGKHKAIQAEVDEVYRKAEAFDKVKELKNGCFGCGGTIIEGHDEMLIEGISDIIEDCDEEISQ